MVGICTDRDRNLSLVASAQNVQRRIGISAWLVPACGVQLYDEFSAGWSSRRGDRIERICNFARQVDCRIEREFLGEIDVSDDVEHAALGERLDIQPVLAV